MTNNSLKISSKTNNKGGGRESGVELLRIIAALFVIVLHYCNGSIGQAFDYVRPGSVNEFILLACQSLAVCAVDVFVLISGYFLCTSKIRTWDKPLALLIQLILFSVLYYLITTLASGQQIQIGILAQRFLPKNYFVILYVALYVISPYINCAIDELNK